MAITWDGQVGPPTRRCARSGRELLAGETVIGILRRDGDRFVRTDVAQETWTGEDDDGIISWWRCRIPVPGPQKTLVLDTPALLRIQGDLATRDDQPARVLRWIIVLWLLRSRVFTLLGMAKDGSMHLKDRTGVVWVVPDPKATVEEYDRAGADLLAAGGANEAVSPSSPSP